MKNLSTNQKRALVVVPILLIVLAGAGMVTAQGMGHGNGMGGGGHGGFGDGESEFGPGHRLEMMAKRMELSDDQQASIKKIFEDGSKDGLEKRKELMRLRNEMQGEMLKDSPSEKSVLGINDKMGALKTEMKALHLKTRLAVRQELTPEQRDQMLAMGGHRSQCGSKRIGACDGSRGGQGHHRGGNFGK